MVGLNQNLLVESKGIFVSNRRVMRLVFIMGEYH